MAFVTLKSFHLLGRRRRHDHHFKFVWRNQYFCRDSKGENRTNKYFHNIPFRTLCGCCCCCCLKCEFRNIVDFRIWPKVISKSKCENFIFTSKYGFDLELCVDKYSLTISVRCCRHEMFFIACTINSKFFFNSNREEFNSQFYNAIIWY